MRDASSGEDPDRQFQFRAGDGGENCFGGGGFSHREMRGETNI
jgi:hypothetical protein